MWGEEEVAATRCDYFHKPWDVGTYEDASRYVDTYLAVKFDQFSVGGISSLVQDSQGIPAAFRDFTDSVL
jgi:hypothetical protein